MTTMNSSPASRTLRPALFILLSLLVGCQSDETSAAAALDPHLCQHEQTEGATSPCLSPSFPADHYVQQANKYFDTLDTSADPASIPDYSGQVARWEWPPWLLLTALGRDDMISTAAIIRQGDPSTVPVRDCRFFDKQPFARCTVTFEYEEGSCPIYEEFTFNDAGEMTFIEAWSDQPGLAPQQHKGDFWGEEGNIARLSTRVPGLGTPTGAFDLHSRYMKDAAALDPDLADFATRASDWWGYWFEALAEAPQGFFSIGCGW